MVKLLPKRQQKIKPYINSPKLTGWKSWIPFAQTIVDSYVQDINDELAKHTIQDARKKLYDNMTPKSYEQDPRKAASRMIGALQGNPDKKKVLTRKIASKHGRGTEYDFGLIGLRDDIWATYLQIPENQRHHGKVVDRYKLQKSQYSPTQGNEGNQYYSIPLGSMYEGLLIQKAKNSRKEPPLQFGESRVSNALSHFVGPHTISRGIDPQKGEYISYYDKWDISGQGHNDGDNMGNIGKPVNIYGRVYLDNYYGINSRPNKDEYYGGYLPEVIVKNKRK